jgi:predicted outer membrane protein
MMIDDHSLAEVKLRTAARAAGVALPSPAPTGDNATIDRSTGTMASPQPDDSPPPGGRGRAYFSRQADAHATMLTLLNNEIATGGSAALKQWASDMLPIVQKHLDIVRQYLDGTASPAPRSPDPASPVAPPPSPRGTPSVNITPTPMRSSSP